MFRDQCSQFTLKETNDITNLLVIVLSLTTGAVFSFQSSMTTVSVLNNVEPKTMVSNTIRLIIYNSVVNIRALINQEDDCYWCNETTVNNLTLLKTPNPVFYKLFFEAEPFVAIWIPHGPMGVARNLPPEGTVKFEGKRFLDSRQQARGSAGALKLPQWGLRRSPDCK